MKITTDITLDLAEPNYGALVGAVQNDTNTRTVRAKLLDRGKPWKIPAEVDAAVAYQKADGTRGWYDLLADGSPAVILQGITVTIVLAGQMLTTPGRVRAGIVFHDSALNQLTTFPFTILVEENPLSDGEKSCDYIRLQWLEAKLEEYLEAAKSSGAFDGKDGESAVLEEDSVSYQSGTSGTIPPSGPWQGAIPVVPKGCYLWTKRTKQWSNHSPVMDYSVSYMGLDGEGTVSSVSGIFPDSEGNISLTAADVGSLDVKGGTMQGAIHMNGQKLTGLNDPTAADEAVRKAYVDKSMRAAAPYNLLDNSDFRHPVAQAGIGGSHGAQAYAVDRWILSSGAVSWQEDVGLALNGAITQKLEYPPAGNVSAFVGMASGQASITYSGGTVTITSSGGVIAWAALYEGTFTQETMPEYRPKGYGAELAECTRYFQLIPSLARFPKVGIGANSIDCFIFTPNMRVVPTIDLDKFTVRTIGSVAVEGFTANVFASCKSYGVVIRFEKKAHGLTDAQVLSNGVPMCADL